MCMCVSISSHLLDGVGRAWRMEDGGVERRKGKGREEGDKERRETHIIVKLPNICRQKKSEMQKRNGAVTSSAKRV